MFVEYNLLNTPGHIINIHESGFQLNNKPGEVIDTKDARDVSITTASEHVETINDVACCNPDECFLPPYCIFQRTCKKAEFEGGIAPGSKIVMRIK